MTHSTLERALMALVVVACFDKAEAGQNAPGTRALSVLPSNPAYFKSPDGKPVFPFGDDEGGRAAATGGTTDPNYDFRLMFDTIKNAPIQFRPVMVIRRLEAEWDSETFPDQFHRFNITPYMHSGQRFANNCRLKYDLTRFNPFIL
jgi:hypothetical protein